MAPWRHHVVPEEARDLVGFPSEVPVMVMLPFLSPEFDVGFVRSSAVSSALASVSFREELHAIEAAIAGQGVAICSDVLIAPELENGKLVPVSNVTLSGYGFYIVHKPDHPRAGSVQAFVDRARAVA